MRYDIIGLIDDDYENYLKYKYDYKYLGDIKSHEFSKDVFYVIGIANLDYRKKITEAF